MVNQQKLLQNNSENPSESVERQTDTKLYFTSIYENNIEYITENPDEDTIFELLLSNPNATTTKITIAQSAYPRILANPTFLEWISKQILGYDKVIVKELWEATKWADEKWTITKQPLVYLVPEDRQEK